MIVTTRTRKSLSAEGVLDPRGDNELIESSHATSPVSVKGSPEDPDQIEVKE